ncbi:MAG TPA: type II secretion system secretin GspD [Kofleriaceae bacterium]|nr:type II secretion system secretin GspD [Kofleriaceae bacterium]
MRRSPVVCVAVVAALAARVRADTTETPTAPVEAPPPGDPLYACKRPVGEVAVTFKADTDLKDLLTWVMGFTCQSFVMNPKVVVTDRKITIIAPAPMTPSEAYQLFLGALARMGLTVVRDGKLLYIVEAQTAKRESLPFVTGPGSTEQVVRMVIRPRYAKPDTLKSAFEALRSEAGDLQQFGSLLMITDYTSHVRDMASLAKLIDVPGDTEGVYTIPVTYADATKLATKIDALLGITASATSGAPPPPAAGGPHTAAGGAEPSGEVPSKILVDERTNTLLVTGSEAAYARVNALKERLDIPLDIEGGSSIHVYQLHNAVGAEVAKTINDAIARSSSAGKAAGASSPAPPAAGATPSIEGSAHVIADDKSNKLLVSASGRDYLAIKDVIDQLDEPRRQVYIDTVILTIDVSNERDLGSSSHGALPIQNGSGIELGGVQTATLSTLDLATSLVNATGLIAGVVGQNLPGLANFPSLGTTFPSYALLFQAVAIASNTSTVSEPSIIAVDNETTKFSVGQNVPYIRGVIPVSSTNPTSLTTTNIDRADLNFDLELTPHISSNDNILLQIKNDAKALGTSDKQLGPSWNTRSFETRVVVHDRATVVLSGIMQTSDVTSTTKVPLLGDIPLLGYFFKYTTHTKRRSNVLILLTPYIIKDALDLQQISERMQRQHDEFVTSYRTLDHMRYEPQTDYRRKRGLLEEINRSVQAVDDDLAARAALHPPAQVIGGPVR